MKLQTACDIWKAKKAKPARGLPRLRGPEDSLKSQRSHRAFSGTGSPSLHPTDDRSAEKEADSRDILGSWKATRQVLNSVTASSRLSAW